MLQPEPEPEKKYILPSEADNKEKRETNKPIAKDNLPNAREGFKMVQHDDHFHEVPIDVPDTWQNEMPQQTPVVEVGQDISDKSTESPNRDWNSLTDAEKSEVLVKGREFREKRAELSSRIEAIDEKLSDPDILGKEYTKLFHESRKIREQYPQLEEEYNRELDEIYGRK